MHTKTFTFREFTLSPVELQSLAALTRDALVVMDGCVALPPEAAPRQQLLVVVAKAVAALNVPAFKEADTVVRLDDVAQTWVRWAANDWLTRRHNLPPNEDLLVFAHAFLADTRDLAVAK